MKHLRVNLIEPPARPPANPIEQCAIALLKASGSMSLSELARQAAYSIYQDEIRRGAAVLDIGLYGPRLFHSEVASGIRAGDGALWRIEGPEAEKNEEAAEGR